MSLPNVRFSVWPTPNDAGRTFLCTLCGRTSFRHGGHGTAAPSDHVGPEGFPEWRITLHEVGFVSRSFSIGEARLSDLPERIGDHLGGARVTVEGVQ